MVDRRKWRHISVLLMSWAVYRTTSMHECSLSDEGADWNMAKFIAAHKQYHNVQTKLHQEHNYQDFPARDKVNYFLGGINNSQYVACIFQIKNSPTQREDFELAAEGGGIQGHFG